MDCDAYNFGCGGAYPASTLTFLQKTGTVLESLDPYLGYQTACPKALST